MERALEMALHQAVGEKAAELQELEKELQKARDEAAALRASLRAAHTAASSAASQTQALQAAQAARGALAAAFAAQGTGEWAPSATVSAARAGVESAPQGVTGVYSGGGGGEKHAAMVDAVAQAHATTARLNAAAERLRKWGVGGKEDGTAGGTTGLFGRPRANTVM